MKLSLRYSKIKTSNCETLFKYVTFIWQNCFTLIFTSNVHYVLLVMTVCFWRIIAQATEFPILVTNFDQIDCYHRIMYHRIKIKYFQFNWNWTELPYSTPLNIVHTISLFITFFNIQGYFFHSLVGIQVDTTVVSPTETSNSILQAVSKFITG